MRIIKFRGQRVSDKVWIYGMPTSNMKYIFNEEDIDSPDNYEVVPETVGQFTGLTDKNGKEIYEGDIARCYFKRKIQHNPYNSIREAEEQNQAVFYSSHLAGFFIAVDVKISEEKYKDELQLTEYRANNFLEVIGNVYSNPELLK